MQTKITLDRDRAARSRLITVESIQDVEPILEENKRLRSEQQKSDWGRHIADIPNVILVRWLNEAYAHGNTSMRLFCPEFKAMIKKKLNDSEWAYLRTDK